MNGGKVLSGRGKQEANRATVVLWIAAFTLLRSKSALDANLRGQRSRFGTPEMITTKTHKLACLVYSMLEHGAGYVVAGRGIL